MVLLCVVYYWITVMKAETNCVCVCVSHQFEAAVAEDVLIIKNQPGKNKEERKTQVDTI